MNAVLKDRCTVCGKSAIAMGFCSTHYAREKQRSKIKALNDIMAKVDKLKSTNPELSEILDELTAEARPLFVDHRRRKPSEMADKDLVLEMASLKKEISDLKQVMALLKKK